MTLALTAFGLSFLLGMLLTPVGGYLAHRFGVLRRPEGGAPSDVPSVPVAGGPIILLIAAGVTGILALCGLVPVTGEAAAGLGAATIVCLLGVLDDRHGL